MRIGRALYPLTPLAVFILTFVVYAATRSPSLNFEDPSEFALGAASLGVNHPSGYPLETLWAHLFTYLPGDTLPGRMNLSSSVAGALASAFLFVGLRRVIAAATSRPAWAELGAWAGAGAFAFSSSFWTQALILEVYALNAALIAATLWAATRCHDGGGSRWFFLTVFLTALGICNHPASFLLTGPLVLTLLVSLARRAVPLYPLITASVAAAALGLSVYLYLPLRAAQYPPLNWGLPYDLPAFFDHLRRREFGTIYWPRFRYLGYHGRELAGLTWRQFGPGVATAGVWGLAFALALRHRAVVCASALAFIAGPGMLIPLVGLLTPIQVFEIDVWFIPFFMLAAALAGYGLALLASRLARRPAIAAGAATVLALTPLYPLLYHGRGIDWRGYDYAATYGRNLLRSYPYRATLLISFYNRLGSFEQGYETFVNGRRPDLAIADSRAYLRGIVNPRTTPRHIVDPTTAERWWWYYRQDLISTAGTAPVFLNGEEQVPGGPPPEPFGLSYVVRPTGRLVPLPWAPPWDRYEFAESVRVGDTLTKTRPPYEPTTYRVWANYYATAARYCFLRGKTEPALRNLAVASRMAPRDDSVAWFLASVYDAYGYSRRAIPLYLLALARYDRYRNDALMFRVFYADLNRSLGIAYLKIGDNRNARRYLEESLAYGPDQPALRALLNSPSLAAP